jgi:signal transduction histidine kinase
VADAAYARQMPFPAPTEQPSAGAAAVNRSPLLQAALALVPPSATHVELRQRFADAGADLQPDIAERLLEDLADLGLVKSVRRDRDDRRYVATSLGTRSLNSSLHAQAAVHLEELERLRTGLLSTIAHELRTPLTAVRTSVGLLLEASARPTEDQRRTMLESIERNSDRMQRLIGDILDLARFRDGRLTLQLRRFGANSLTESAVQVIAPLAAKRNQSIPIEARVSNEHQVYGDRRRLEQALLNLISNASKFTDDGGTIRVSVEARGGSTAWIVRDEGPGISDADQARLFERFFVGRSDRSAPREGVGLGLPTALAIAQAHGGTISASSAIGHGSTFTLIVPTGGPEDDE